MTSATGVASASARLARLFAAVGAGVGEASASMASARPLTTALGAGVGEASASLERPSKRTCLT